MKVPDLVLHASAAQQLETFLQAPKHAVLLAGAAGSGKTHIADELARQLLRIENLETHAYYRRLVPLKGVITIEQVRELIGFFQLKVPGRAAIKRVAVLCDADSMGVEAQNALLKLLEEPPDDSVLVLTSSWPQNLLPTIRSRTQLLTLASPDAAALEAHFTGQGFSAEAVSAALLRGGTDIAEVRRLLAPEMGDDTSLALVKQVLVGTAYERLLLVDTLAKQKEAATEFVTTLAAVAFASLQTAAAKGSGSIERWRSVLQAAHEARSAFEKNGNAKIVLTELMLAL